MRKYYEQKRKPIEPFKKGELVMLNGKNIRTKHQCKKSEDKMYGPFEDIDMGKNARYCKLRVPDPWMIHAVIDIALLEKYRGTDRKNKCSR